MQNDTSQMTPIYNSKDSNNNTCYNFYPCGNRPDNVDTYWYYFDISNNGDIPDDELNYQTSNINSIEATSTMKGKILVRRLGSDMNNEYHKETNVVVQLCMPNDHSKQDQHNQRKHLKRYDHTSKEDHTETRDDDETKVIMSTIAVIFEMSQLTCQVVRNNTSFGDYDDDYGNTRVENWYMVNNDNTVDIR